MKKKPTASKQKSSSSAKLKIVIPDQCSFSFSCMFAAASVLCLPSFVTSWRLMLWAHMCMGHGLAGAIGLGSWMMVSFKDFHAILFANAVSRLHAP